MAQHHHHHHMTRNDWIRLGVVLLVAIGALYLVYPFWPLQDVVQLGLDLQGGVRMVLEGEGVDEMGSDLRAETIDRLITIIDNRINQYGLANTEIRKFGGNRILVNLPGATDPEAARRLFGQTALLEFRRVIESGSNPLDDLTPRSSMQEVLKNRDGIPFLVSTEVLVTGAALSDASVRAGQSLTSAGQYQIALEFTQEGAQEFAKVLVQLGTGEQMAIILDNTVYSAPVIQESIVQVARSQGWRGVKDGR